jgi:hypothetical protein
VIDFPHYVLTRHKEQIARDGLGRLLEALECFKAIGADRTVARVQSAISSAKGAARHAAHKDTKARERSLYHG